MSLVRSLFFSIPLIVLSTIAMGTLSLGASFFDRTGNSQHAIARVWAKMLLAVSFIRVRAEGLEKLDRNGVYVFAGNHASLMDIPALLSLLPYQFRFFAKKGLFGIPFLGTHLRRAGHVEVDRSSARA
jgi:1-acyl-sn-glycerol-3-phosphate acyltransferase